MSKSEYWKHPKFGFVYCGSVPTPIGRFCWPALVNPKDPPPPQEGQPAGAPRYEVTLLLEKDNPAVMSFLEEMKKTTDGGLAEFNKGRKAQMSGCKLISDGDEMDMEKYPYYKNCWVMIARNKELPKIVDKSKNGIQAMDIKGGMKGRLVVTPLITAHGISYKLGAVQLMADDGVRFGGGARDVTDLLEAIEETDSEQEAASTTQEETPPTPKTKQTKKTGKEGAVDLLC